MIEFKSITPTSLVLDPFQVAGFLGQLLAESYPSILYPNHIPWLYHSRFWFPLLSILFIYFPHFVVFIQFICIFDIWPLFSFLANCHSFIIGWIRMSVNPFISPFSHLAHLLVPVTLLFFFFSPSRPLAYNPLAHVGPDPYIYIFKLSFCRI